MNYDVLVEQVVTEVMRRLQTLPQVPQPPERKVRALAIFTGGTIGMEESFIELTKLQKQGFFFTVVLSQAAEQVIGLGRITAQLGSSVKIITAASPYPGKELRDADLVLVPVLTQNTAAKIAHTQADTLCTTLIMQALMMGKPVVAAQNAADPGDWGRRERNMGKASPALMAALTKNLETIAQFGIHLTPALELAKVCFGSLSKAVKVEAVVGRNPKSGTKRAVLDAKIVQAAVAQGLSSISVVPGALITPLARDMARDYGITFSQE
ncbi:MAG: flavoprotein [Sporomusaceae bacterium]|nr:flavoprotein [Sporomusaceae bacterium]